MSSKRRAATRTTAPVIPADLVPILVPHSKPISVLFGGVIRKAYEPTNGVVLVETADVHRFINAVAGAHRADNQI